jgi:hypothetical protein
MSDDVFTITPTVLYRLDPSRDLAGAATARTEIGEALLVFRSEADAEAFRRSTGRCPASEGFGAVNVDHEQIAHILAWHGLSVVAMPEPWTGRGRVDLFSAENFLQFLEESVPTEA